MEPFKIALLLLICLIIVWCIGASCLRGFRSRSSWVKTRGRVKSFGINYGIPSISYDYTVQDRTLEGTKFTPGPMPSSVKVSGIKIPRSLYLNSDSSLKFAPNTEVDVFYDTNNPCDSALIQGFQLGKGMFLVVLLLGLLGFAYIHLDRLQSHLGSIVSTVLFSAGLFLFCWGGRWLRRYLCSQHFPSAQGRLLNTEIVYSESSGGSNGGGGGYCATVDFEYEVHGVLYRSQQLNSLPLWMMKSRIQDVQPLIDRLKKETDLRVFYDPAAPWDGFLLHVSLLGALTPLLMGVPFTGFGIFMGLHYLRH